MWDQVKKLPPILVGQIIFSCLDMKSIVRLETALVSIEQTQTLCSFLCYTSEIDIEVHIPKDLSKLTWLQDHDLAITKAIVHLDKMKATFQTHMINKIELVDNRNVITSKILNYLPDGCYEKVISINFERNHSVNLMEELFSRLHNLREVKVSCIPDGWIQSALRALHRETNKNIFIEDIQLLLFSSIKVFSVAEIAEYCPRLQSFSVYTSIAEDSLIALSRHCPLLKKLKVPNFPRISTEESAALCAPALSCIHSIWTSCDDDNLVASNYALAIPYLTELRLVIIDNKNDRMLIPLMAQYCPMLETVQINYCSNVTPAQLLQLAQNCRYLKVLMLSNTIFYSDEVVIGLAERCPKLQTLTLLGYGGETDLVLTDAALLALSENCSQLEELDVYGDFAITEAAVEQLIQQCKKLRKLELCAKTVMFEGTVLGVPVVVEVGEGIVEHIFHTGR